MKVVELLEMGSKMLKLMSDNDVNRDYYKYVPMYHEYTQMRKNGMKYRAAVDMLAKDYRVSRASIERAIRKLQEDC